MEAYYEGGQDPEGAVLSYMERNGVGCGSDVGSGSCCVRKATTTLLVLSSIFQKLKVEYPSGEKISH